MVTRNAKHLILLSRKSIHSTVVMDFLAELQSKGAVVVTPCCDVTDEAKLALTITECSKTMPPIKGCIQASLVLKVRLGDRLFCMPLLIHYRTISSKACPFKTSRLQPGLKL